MIASSPLHGPPPTPPEVAADQRSSSWGANVNPPAGPAPWRETRAPPGESSSRTTLGEAKPPVPPAGSIDTDSGPVVPAGIPETHTQSPVGCQAARTTPAGAPSDAGHSSTAAARVP